uniref:DUF4419 domain-containing protein n=1 Tax=Mycena chlorophos TaxID=658473 RepID=A0ABQ0LV78_MYCCL|nr:predicted protein [Mycena chlorophos]
MPVTFKVANHKAETVAGSANYSARKTAREILAVACQKQYKNAGAICGTSFDEPHANSLATEANLRRQPSNEVSAESTITNVIPKGNGFFHALSEAYNHHHHLVLRPDDVWLAILVQFNFFVNANSEALRASFVAHEGQKTLTVERATLTDLGEFARAMTGEIEKNVVDPTLRSWALPNFSTTTVKDTTVASIMLMATLKAYFQYRFGNTICGIPSVTLEGEKADWEALLQRAEKLKEYGIETIAWYHLLVPVLTRFVKAFDDPEAKSNISFWSKVADHRAGSGMSSYTGWATAFAVFSEKGKWLGHPLKRWRPSRQSTTAPELMSAQEFWATYLQQGLLAAKSRLILDGTPYHAIEGKDVPPCYAEVDVLLQNKETGEQTATSMIAGVIGLEVCSSSQLGLLPQTAGDEPGVDDLIKPLAGWWLFEKLNANA